ncbi:hypothetical protein [Actinoplanes sp. NPDC049681]|uniref:hypothetical protein n=1 Tax=Actinoplanes sp. NPDC049681 TaxID=3363905 RepID=UPI003795A6BD
MSYAVQYPAAAAPAPTATPRRPVSVGFASVLLIVMAVVGLGYAVAMLAVAPGTVDRFRDAAGASADVDGFVTVVWIEAALGAVLAVILFALYVVLALGLRRGSNGIRIATLVVCALGLVAGGVSTLTMAVQRGGESAPGSIGAALADAYPGAWIGLNVGLAVAQMAGYLLVGLLLLAAPRWFFGRAPKPVTPDPFAAPRPAYGPPGGYQPMYGAPYPAAPQVPVPVESPGEPSPWAPPRPVVPSVGPSSVTESNKGIPGWPPSDVAPHRPWPAAEGAAAGVPSAERPPAADSSWAAPVQPDNTGGTSAGNDPEEGSPTRPSS